MHCHRQSGNVFYVILIGIVLFAALSAVIVQSGKGDTSSLSNEKAEIYAAEILQYSSAMAGAVRRMMMVNECSDTDISFYKSGITHAGFLHSPDVPTKCQVYHPDGGSMTYQVPRPEWMQYTAYQEWLMSGVICFKNTGTFSSGCTNSEAELTLGLYGIKKEICDQINKKLGIAVSAPPSESLASGRFNGTYTGTYLIGGVNAATTGKKGFCLQDTDGSSAGYYSFVYVLLPR